MADVVITAANVVADPGADIASGTSGDTITAGMALAYNPDTSRIVRADADSPTPALRDVIGIALNGAANGQPINYARSGTLTIGGTIVRSTIYILSNTPGLIAPAADLSAGEYTAVIGVGISTTKLKLGILNSGVTI